MLFRSEPGREMRRLMQKYTEAALAYSELLQVYSRRQRRTGRAPAPLRVERALNVREAAWLSWEAHVAGMAAAGRGG